MLLKMILAIDMEEMLQPIQQGRPAAGAFVEVIVPGKLVSRHNRQQFSDLRSKIYSRSIAQGAGICAEEGLLSSAGPLDNLRFLRVGEGVLKIDFVQFGELVVEFGIDFVGMVHAVVGTVVIVAQGVNIRGANIGLIQRNIDGG